MKHPLRLPLWRAVGRVLRPVTHVGISEGTSRGEERELVTANVVVIFSILVTVPDALNYFSLGNTATTYAAITASSAVCAYLFGYLLLCLGYRAVGVFLFTSAVLMNLAVLTLILGTRCGVQYYFIAVGVGAMFVWPRAYKRMRLPQAALGLVLFVVILATARPDPFVGSPLPQEIINSIFHRETIGAYVIACALTLYSLSSTERAETALEKAHQQSESLLLNILPQAIAERLKRNSELVADAFDDVTILFADVVGFTPMSEHLRPDEVVHLLNRLFSEFDVLAQKHGLEKIKTIGDAYMVGAGIPERRADHAQAVAAMALEMQRSAATIRTPVGEELRLRIGINTGPAIAGVIGTKKFSYDLWGDTVNTASRMESHGIPGTIQVTARTRELLANDFEFKERGMIDVKGKGVMPVFILLGRRSKEQGGEENSRGLGPS